MLKHDLGDLLLALLRVHWGVGQEHVYILRVQVKLLKDVLPQVDHVIRILNDTSLDGELEFMSRPVGKGLVSIGIDYFWLIGLCAWGPSSYLRRIHGDSVGANNCGDDKTGEVFSGETSLDEACTVVNDQVFFLVEEDLHLLKSLLNCSHLISN